MTAGHKNQGKSGHIKKRGQGKRKKKDAPSTDPTKNGVRIGYHSEAANPPGLNDTPVEGMKVGYHSEAANVSKTEDVGGMRVGYHSERANPPRADQKDGMNIGYHSETANPPKKWDQDSEAGMNIGYHSEAANIGSHSKRLHSDKDSRTGERAEEEDGPSD